MLRIVCNDLSLGGSVSAGGLRGRGAGSGGGSGGALLVNVTGSLSGSGTISADGGAGTYSLSRFGGAGGGGIVWLYARDLLSFSGVVSSFPGSYVYASDSVGSLPVWPDSSGSVVEWIKSSAYLSAASCGLVLLNIAGVVEMRVVDSGKPSLSFSFFDALDGANVDETVSIAVKASTVLPSAPSLATVDVLRLGAYASLVIRAGSTLEVVASIANDGTGSVTPSLGGTLKLPSSFTHSGGTISLEGTLLGASSLVLNGSQMFLHPGGCWTADITKNASGSFNATSLTLSQSSRVWFVGGDASSSLYSTLRLGELSVDYTSSVSASGQGFSGALFSAIGNSSRAAMSSVVFGNGGSHAGSGGGMGGGSAPSSGCSYGPTTYGLGGGASSRARGASGGGRIRIVVGAAVTLNGTVSADGLGCVAGSAGAGAGGSIWIEASQVTGSGSVSAAGGSGCALGGGGGSGGRIALWVADSGAAFSGKFSVAPGAQSAGALLRPAGGIVFVANRTGGAGVVMSHDNCSFGASVSICAQTSPLDFAVTSVLLSSAPTVLDTPGTLTSSAMGTLSTDPRMRNFQTVCDRGSFVLGSNFSSLLLTSDLLIEDYDVSVRSGSLVVKGDVFIADGELVVAPYSGIVSNGTAATSNALLFNNLSIASTGGLRFAQTSIFRDTSITLASTNLNIQGALLANAVVLNSYSVVSSLDSNPSCFGRTSDGKSAGGGGGNAGSGTPGFPLGEGGTFSGAATGPSGSGGAGGGGGQSRSGGAGGLGIRIVASGMAVIDGQINISGESARDGSGAGGGRQSCFTSERS